MPDYASLTVNVKELIAAVSEKLAPGELGVLASTLADLLDIKAKRSLKFAVALELWDEFRNPEFIAGFGKDRIDGVELLRFAFLTSDGPGEACTTIASMHEAGAFGDDDTIHSEAFIEGLHAGIHKWAAGANFVAVEPIARLLHAFCSEMDTFSQVGKFLAAFLNHGAASRIPQGTIHGVLEALCGSEDVRDLSGKPEHLIELLPERYEALVTDNLLNAGATGVDSDDSDLDENGHLKGFVVDDDHVDYSGSEDDDDDDSDSDSRSSSGSSSASSSSSSSEGGSESSASQSDSDDSSSRKGKKSRGKASKSQTSRKEGNTTKKRRLVKAADKQKAADKHAVGSKRRRRDSSSSDSDTADSDSDDSDSEEEERARDRRRASSSSSSSSSRSAPAAKRPRKDDSDDSSSSGGSDSGSRDGSGSDESDDSKDRRRRKAKGGNDAHTKKRKQDEGKHIRHKRGQQMETGGRKRGSAPDVSRYFESSATVER